MGLGRFVKKIDLWLSFGAKITAAKEKRKSGKKTRRRTRLTKSKAIFKISVTTKERDKYK